MVVLALMVFFVKECGCSRNRRCRHYFYWKIRNFYGRTIFEGRLYKCFFIQSSIFYLFFNCKKFCFRNRFVISIHNRDIYIGRFII